MGTYFTGGIRARDLEPLYVHPMTNDDVLLTVRDVQIRFESIPEFAAWPAGRRRPMSRTLSITALAERLAELEAENLRLRNYLGNCEGEAVDAGTYCAGAMDVRNAIGRLGAEIERLRWALTTLERWDMLTLNPDGSGAATDDAPWARKLIADALAHHAEAR